MFDILRQKILRLGRDEDGAALVITLAMLMFLYASCAGVFAIGRTVKDRIHLQNACDAAAYSAAVVQADTLSRIATINRAMSWTYASLCNREMDYIVYKWLKHASDHYGTDREIAIAGGGDISGSSVEFSDKSKMLHLPNAKFNKYLKVMEADWGKESIEWHCKEFLSTKLSGDSFYAGGGAEIGALIKQISVDKHTISNMNDAVAVLRDSLADRVKNATKCVLERNIPTGLENYRYKVQSLSGDSYLTIMDDEERFLDFSKNAIDFPSWYKKSADEGFCRNYDRENDPLKAEWWWWIRADAFARRRAGVCLHTAGDCGDHCVKGGEYCHAILMAEKLHDDCYDGQLAQPLELTRDYFGPAGTITVGLAKYNENPWFGVLKRVVEYVENGAVLRGIHGAFNPFVEWSWALSSAKAGYKFLGQDDDFESGEDDFDLNDARAYRVSWEDDQSWNLCQSDWDAVFVPVRSNWLGVAEDGSWGGEDSSALLDGEWEPLGAGAGSREFAVHNIKGLPRMHNGGSVDGTLQLGRLKDLFFH